MRARRKNNDAFYQELAEDIFRRLSSHPGSCGIIYCLSRDSCEEVSEALNRRLTVMDAQGRKRLFGPGRTYSGAEPCLFYHAKSDNRAEAHRAWAAGKAAVIVATIAFGMGINKPNVRWVFHLNMPKSLMNYYQESGRAGRDGGHADCVLFFSAKDYSAQMSMIDSNAKEDQAFRDTQPEKRAALARMHQYCQNDAVCRRQFLVESFGEPFDPRLCQRRCDVCKEDRAIEHIDVSHAARAAVEMRAWAAPLPRRTASPADHTPFPVSNLDAKTTVSKAMLRDALLGTKKKSTNRGQSALMEHPTYGCAKALKKNIVRATGPTAPQGIRAMNPAVPLFAGTHTHTPCHAVPRWSACSPASSRTACCCSTRARTAAVTPASTFASPAAGAPPCRSTCPCRSPCDGGRRAPPRSGAPRHLRPSQRRRRRRAPRKHRRPPPLLHRPLGEDAPRPNRETGQTRLAPPPSASGRQQVPALAGMRPARASTALSASSATARTRRAATRAAGSSGSGREGQASLGQAWWATRRGPTMTRPRTTQACTRTAMTPTLRARAIPCLAAWRAGAPPGPLAPPRTRWARGCRTWR